MPHFDFSSSLVISKPRENSCLFFVVFLVLRSCLAAVSVYSLLAFLYFWAELRWSMVGLIQNTSPQNTPAFSELKNRNCQGVACFLPTLCFADAEGVLGEESSLNFTSGIWSIYQYSPCTLAIVCRTTTPVLRGWAGSTVLILAHS